jgi:hypothetical protein
VNPPRPTGIIEGDEGGVDPFLLRLGYSIQNAWWQDLGNNTWVGVYAGTHTDDPTQGLVVVVSLPHDVVYTTTVKAGSLRIVAEANFRLTLLSTDGTTFYFDVPGRQFVDSLTEVVPTVTPYMTETPSATWTPGPAQTPWPTCTPGPTPTFALIVTPHHCSG